MKTPGLSYLLDAARGQYDRFMHATDTTTDKAEQRRYIRDAEKTIVSAEKIIAQLKTRVKAAEKSLTAGASKSRRKAKRAVTQSTTAAKKAVAGAKKSVTSKVTRRKKRI